LQINTKNVSCHTADSKSVKQEVNGTVILPPLVFPVHRLDQDSLTDGGRISTVDLLVLKSSDQLLFIKKLYISILQNNLS
jgi:hypothetical protein